jgi:hypothetical protein
MGSPEDNENGTHGYQWNGTQKMNKFQYILGGYNITRFHHFTL